MAPLPSNNTPIYEVFYTVNGHQHSSQVRSGVLSPSAFGTVWDALMIALGTTIYPTVVDFVTFQAAGTNVSNIVTTGIEGNTYGAGTPSTATVPQYFDFVGRSSGGRRVRLAIFGATTTGNDYRIVAGEVAAIDAAIGVLNAATQAFFAIDGIKALWKSYANAGVNAYWQRAIRP